MQTEPAGQPSDGPSGQSSSEPSDRPSTDPCAKPSADPFRELLLEAVHRLKSTMVSGSLQRKSDMYSQMSARNVISFNFVMPVKVFSIVGEG